jgi:hypothetical protein
LLTAEAAAQRNATLTGRVVADSGGVPIGNAGIRIPELERAPGRQLEHELRAPGAPARFVRSPDRQTWLISSRQSAAHHRLSNAGAGNSLNSTCQAQVVMDGTAISSSTAPARRDLR